MRIKTLIALVCLTSFFSTLSGEAMAQENPRAKMSRSSRELARSYFKALFDAKWEVAAGFLDDSMIETIRQRVLQQVLTKDEGVQAQMFKTLGVKDLNQLRTMEARKFYVLYAKSDVGIGVRAMSKEYAQTRMSVREVSCFPKSNSCLLDLRLKGVDLKTKEKFDRNTKMRTEKINGRWYIALPKRPAAKAP